MHVSLLLLLHLGAECPADTVTIAIAIIVILAN